jgi:hypothetical protein
MFKFDGISQYCNNFEDFIGLFPSILGFSDLVRFWDFSKDFLGFLMEVYEDFQSNLPLNNEFCSDYISCLNMITIHFTTSLKMLAI